MASKTQLETLRELERNMSAELKHLRSVIRAAERGENKRIKNTAQYLKRKGREIERVAKIQEQLREKELTKLEKFLGESFETLGEARAALNKQTRKATKKEIATEAVRLREKASKSKTAKQKQRLEQQARRFERESGKPSLSPNRTSYSVRQLSALEKQDIIDFLNDKKAFNQVGIGYLQPNETLSLSIPYRYRGTDGAMHKGYAQGYKIVRSWSDLYAYIMSYAGEEENQYDGVEDWLGDIHIIKFPDASAQRMSRAKQTDAVHDRRAQMKTWKKEREEEIRLKERKKQEEKQRRTEARLARSERARRELQAQLKQTQERMK